MPLPNKRKDQSDKEFLDTCMGNPTMNKDFPKNDQRYAVCQSQLKKAKKKKTKGEIEAIDFEDQIINDFLVLHE